MKNKTNPFGLKKVSYPFLVALLLFIVTIRCSSSDSGNDLPTPTKFKNLKTKALNSLTQHFQFNTADDFATFISEKNVILSFSSFDFTLNGNTVTGQIDIEYIEIFEGGSMLVTGKHTMGQMPDGKRSVLLSGGEFYINATHNGQQLDLSGSISLQIPTYLTDGDDGGNPNMTLWNLTENDSVWIEDTTEPNPGGANGVQLGEGLEIIAGPAYFAYIHNFGWTNVDCFYSDTRQKTTILSSVPDGYDHRNSGVYLHYDGRGNALAKLDRYNPETKLFSEHYGQMPIGLECHIIFVTESNGQWRYAVKPVTISADAVYNFTLSETTVGSEAQLTAVINALP